MSDIVKKRLYSKMKMEYEDFIDSLKNGTFDNLIDKSYEVTIKREIMSMFYLSNDYDINYILALNNLKYPLEELYQEWLDYDADIRDVLELCFDNFFEKLEEKHKNNKKDMVR